MKEINPHDAYFKKVFTNEVITRDLIKQFVSKETVQSLDLDTLEVTSTSFVDKNLGKHFSDLVFKVKTKFTGNKDEEQRYISLVFEHKTSVTKGLPIQLLTYMALAYNKLRTKKQPYHFVLPILFYHGKFRYKKRLLSDIIPVPSEHFLKFLPNFDFEVIDIRQLTVEQIRNLNVTGMLRDALVLMRYIWDEQVIKQHPEWFFEFYIHYSDTPLGENFFYASVVYLFRQVAFSKIEVQQIMENFSKPIKRKVMSTYDMAVREGEIKGKIEGKMEGKIEAIKGLLKVGVEATIIAKGVGMTTKKIRDIREEMIKNGELGDKKS